MKTKRPATPAEIEQAKNRQAAWLEHNHYDVENGDFRAHVDKQEAEALAEGYENETCSCGCVYLAFHHYTRCPETDCPFKDGEGSLLDRMQRSLDEHVEQTTPESDGGS